MEKKIFKCFIASPSDTIAERDACEIVFNEINKSLGETFHFRIESLRWENDTRPGFGEYSQAVINSQIGNDYQIFIGIIYKKFGTVTKSAGSGTEEEFNDAYNRLVNKEDVEIMFYFNDRAPQKLSEINIQELEKINQFKDKVASLGGYYWKYEGSQSFESNLRSHLNSFFLHKFKGHEDKPKINSLANDRVANILKNRLDNALKIFHNQPIIWVNPTLSDTNYISPNPDDNYEHQVEIKDIITNPTSLIIKAPPQFGLTSLAHYMVKEAWDNGDLWIYLDSNKTKTHTIHHAVENETLSLGLNLIDVKCIMFDSWVLDTSSFKKLKNLCDSHKEIPIIVMQTIDDLKFFDEEDDESIDREFKTLNLLALPRTQIRKLVKEYTKKIEIGDEDVVLSKLVTDLEALNIHRTPCNCITLLKASEKYFDESPVNRTNMLEMVLFVLFNLGDIPTYRSKPDLKDCEYVLGRFCEKIIKNDSYTFSRDAFLTELRSFCTEKLIDLEVELVFDILKANNILIDEGLNFKFKSAYWIFYFGAKRMHNNSDFANYIFSSKKYISFPEIIEFYTGIDRNRTDALTILARDTQETCDIVKAKVQLPDNMNPFNLIRWHPTEEQIEKVQQDISENVMSSGLPDSLKDRHADKTYNQLKPYNQTIHSIFEEYSVLTLMQKIRASSRALRNSDYVNPDVKKLIFSEILRSWSQISNVLLALTPMLATKGEAAFEGAMFELAGDFGDTDQERINMIIQCIPTNVVGFFKDDIFSSKIGPLIYDQFIKETDALKKHHMALLFIFSRPRDWKKYIEEYISSVSKSSFYLYDVVNALRSRYRYDFVDPKGLKEIEYLIKMGLAKHEFGGKKPGLHEIVKISNSNIPKREFGDD